MGTRRDDSSSPGYDFFGASRVLILSKAHGIPASGVVKSRIQQNSHEIFSFREIQKPKGYQLQGLFGVELFVDENLIFRVQSEEARNLFFTIDFFAADHPKATENAPYYMGKVIQ